jgi:hypothetical protein
MHQICKMEVVSVCWLGQGAENGRDRPWKREGKVGWKEPDEKRRHGQTGLPGGQALSLGVGFGTLALRQK